jgi:hypothetical protein
MYKFWYYVLLTLLYRIWLNCQYRLTRIMLDLGGGPILLGCAQNEPAQTRQVSADGTPDNLSGLNVEHLCLKFAPPSGR